MTEAAGAGSAAAGAPAAGAGGAAAGAALTNGSAAAPWMAGMDADLQAALAPKNYGGVGDLAKAYVSLEKTLGADKIVLPGKDAKPEEWAGVYDKLGRPAAADKYDLGDWKPPENAGWNAEAQTKMMGVFHEAGLNSAQAQKLLKSYAELSGAGVKALEAKAGEQAAAGETALKKEWGGEYDAKLEQANRAVKSVFGAALAEGKKVQLADGTFLLDHPGLAKAFAALGATMAEPGELAGGKGAGGGGGAVTTAAQAQAEIERLIGPARGDPKHAYTDPAHPEHKALQKRVADLYRLAHPGEIGAS